MFIFTLNLLFCQVLSLTQLELDEAFEQYVVNFNKTYHSHEEREQRKEIFLRKFAFIETENSKDLPYKLAVNALTDLPTVVYKSNFLGLASSYPLRASPHWLGTFHHSESAAAELPKSIDWSRKHAVTEVKNQGSN